MMLDQDSISETTPFNIFFFNFYVIKCDSFVVLSYLRALSSHLNLEQFQAKALSSSLKV